MVARTRFLIRTDVRTRRARARTVLAAVGGFLLALSFVAAPASAAPAPPANPAHQHATGAHTSLTTPKAAPAAPAASPAHTFHPVAGATDEPQDPAFLGSGTCRSIPSGVCTLRAAVMEANTEGSYIAIVLTSGTYQLTIPPAATADASTGNLDVTDPQTVTFTGAGITHTFIDATGMGDRVFQLEGNAVARMSGFTVQHGNATNTANNTDIGDGGGIDVSSASAALVLQSVRIAASSADFDGGGLYANGSLWATDTQIAGNTAFDGGGLYVNGSAQLVNPSITGNTATDVGGGVLVEYGPAAFQGGTVSGNHVVSDTGAGQGGGLYVYDMTTMVRTTIANNTIAPATGATGNGSDGAQGGGLYMRYGLAQADHLTIRGNTVSGLNDQPQCCSGDGGGGIWDVGGFTLTNSVVSGNKALDGLGGGIVNAGNNTGTSERLSRVTVSGNQAEGDGGGIYDYYGNSVSQSTISGNTAGGHGGGLWNGEDVQIEQSLIANNRAVQGAGIWNQWRAQLTNDTFTGNIASGTGNAGGALFESDLFASETTAHFTNVTISGNRSDDGGGIANIGGGVTLQNTIVSANKDVSGTSDTNCDVTLPLTDVGHNIDSGHTCGLNGPGSRSNTNPKLGALASNGGPTKTMALLTGSPAINAGSSPAPSVDQRGVKRDSRPDIGAFEKK